MLGIFTWLGWAWWSWASAPLEAPSSSDTPEDPIVKIEIQPGTPGQTIGQQLEKAGLIRSTTAWNLWSRWMSLRDRAGGFRAGTYEVSPTQPLDEIAQQIWEGQVVQVSYTIREGWSLKQMAEYLESIGFFPAKDFLAATKKIPKSDYPWLPDGIPHLEGFLYPDTYNIEPELISVDGIIQQMLNRFEQVALPLYQKNQGQTKLDILDWVTLASIVEKEAVIASERNLIAGVFVKRLELGMALGADPTVEYGLGINQTADQPLTLAQVNTPSPYNTYINPGLPPTPIASPGVASLEASLFPEDTDLLYFVAKYDGSHVFSRTLAEHEAAQAKIWDEREAAAEAE